MKEELKKRTKNIGLEVIALIDHLPDKPSGWAIGKQIVRSAPPLGPITVLPAGQNPPLILFTS